MFMLTIDFRKNFTILTLLTIDNVCGKIYSYSKTNGQVM